MVLKDLIIYILAVVGGVNLVLGLIKGLFEVIPELNQLRVNIINTLNRKVKHKKLEKLAIAGNIENVVNASVSSLRKELPQKWLRRVRIKWVEKVSVDDLEEDELIIRIQPFDNQDVNLMNGIYYFFTKSLFLGVKEVIPIAPRKASVLQLSRRTIIMHHPIVKKEFETKYIETAIQADKDIAYYIGNYEKIDQRGFFTSVFLRETAELAETVRYTEKRSQIEDDLVEILNHLVTFIQGDVPDEHWHKKTDTCCYGFLLVARPYNRRVLSYVNRAKIHIENGINRLYVLGANEEKSFVRRVIRTIASRTEYNLDEIFQLHKDYRGESGGICAVFDLSSIIETTNQVIEEFFET
jgi:hypothetical protein